jgi:hypothetical protein
MTTLEPIILSFLANALWQVPLIFCTGWLAARALRSLGAAAEHRLWVGVLLLQTLLPAISTIPREAVSSLFNLFSAPLNTGQPYVSIAMGPGTTFANPHVPAWLLALLTVIYGVVTAWFVIRFLWRLYTTHLLGTEPPLFSLRMPLVTGTIVQTGSVSNRQRSGHPPRSLVRSRLASGASSSFCRRICMRRCLMPNSAPQLHTNSRI